jgi:hypothetical protein
MKISFSLDSFFYTLFPFLKEGKDIDIVNFIEDYYSFGQYRPRVTITENRLNIEIDVTTLLT